MFEVALIFCSLKYKIQSVHMSPPSLHKDRLCVFIYETAPENSSSLKFMTMWKRIYSLFMFSLSSHIFGPCKIEAVNSSA